VRPFLPKLIESRTFIVKAGLIGGRLGFGKSRRLRIATDAFDARRHGELRRDGAKLLQEQSPKRQLTKSAPLISLHFHVLSKISDQ
jgi:hypothetical protein